MIEIKDWGDLAKLPPSKTHIIHIEKDSHCIDSHRYYITPLNTNTHDEYYLSTHVFYGGKITNEYNKLLKKCGFNVKIISWEEE